MADINAQDLDIVRALSQNSETPLSVIADKLGISPRTVNVKVQKLKAMGAIRKFTVSVDWRKLGKKVEIAVLVNCSPKNTRKVAKILSTFDEVIAVHSITGLYEILAMVALRDLKEYKEFIETKLGKIAEIKNIHSGIVLDDFKES